MDFLLYSKFFAFQKVLFSSQTVISIHMFDSIFLVSKLLIWTTPTVRGKGTAADKKQFEFCSEMFSDQMLIKVTNANGLTQFTLFCMIL